MIRKGFILANIHGRWTCFSVHLFRGTRLAYIPFWKHKSKLRVYLWTTPDSDIINFKLSGWNYIFEIKTNLLRSSCKVFWTFFPVWPMEHFSNNFFEGGTKTPTKLLLLCVLCLLGYYPVTKCNLDNLLPINSKKKWQYKWK